MNEIEILDETMSTSSLENVAEVEEPVIAAVSSSDNLGENTQNTQSANLEDQMDGDGSAMAATGDLANNSDQAGTGVNTIEADNSATSEPDGSVDYASVIENSGNTSSGKS